MTITRGVGTRGLLPPPNINPTIMIAAFPFLENEAKPLKAIISDIRRNEFSPVSNIKSLCYLDNILAKQEAVRKEADECIMLNTEGNAACASVANLFVVTEKGVITPGLEDGVLPGITRKTVIQICKENHISIFEEKISKAVLMSSREIFFTNRLIGIQPVAELNGCILGKGSVGKTAAMLQVLYKNYINKLSNNEKN